MKCHQVRAALPLLVYGNVEATQKAALSDHLTHCADCRRAQRELERVRRLLDIPSAPVVEVDVPWIYRTVSDRQARRWRRVAVSLGAVAALLLLVVGLRLDVRLSAGQLLVRWGEPPAPAVVPSEVIVKQSTLPPETEAELRLLSELIHALKQDADVRDRQYQERLDLLQSRLHTLQTQADQRWDCTEQDVAALYLLTRKGDKP